MGSIVLEDWLIGIAGCVGWNVLLWGLAYDKSSKRNKVFNWACYKRRNLDDLLVTFIVGVPLVVWKSEFIWDLVVNKLGVYFNFLSVEISYDRIGLVFSGPVIQISYAFIKRMNTVLKK